MTRILAVLGALAASFAARAQEASPFAVLDRFLTREVADGGIPALSVALVDGGRVVWSKGYGFTDAARKTPATAATVYRAGPVSEVVTAATVLRLAARGRLDLDAPVTKYLTDFKPINRYEKNITMRHLLTHRSGLPAEPPRGHSADADTADLGRTVLSLNSSELVAEPGARQRDSRAGYAVLGRVVEVVRQQPFGRAVFLDVLDPLGMKDSGFDDDGDRARRRVGGRIATLHGRILEAPPLRLGVAPALGLETTADDLGRFAADLLTTGAPPNLDAGTFDGRKCLTRGGSHDGYTAEFALLPDDKVAVVVLAARNRTDGLTRTAADLALRQLLAARSRQGDEADPKPIPERWRGLIGEYGPEHAILYILEKGNRLHALVDGTEREPLDEDGPDAFHVASSSKTRGGDKVLFTRDPTGRATRVEVGGVAYARRRLDGEDGSTFRIRPLHKIDELRRAALQEKPPKEIGEFLKPDLVALDTLDSTLKFDLRYKTDNNFLGAPLYSAAAKAYLQRPAAEALVRVHKGLAADGYGLLIHDGYRPWHVTKMFWEATPPAQRTFVADPSRGSRHNRGCAVDLTLFDRATGKAVVMPSGYDEFSDRAYPDYPGGTSEQRHRRDRLRRAMAAEGFAVYEAEWWHFDYKDWKKYPILDARFEDLGRPAD